MNDDFKYKHRKLTRKFDFVNQKIIISLTVIVVLSIKRIFNVISKNRYYLLHFTCLMNLFSQEKFGLQKSHFHGKSNEISMKIVIFQTNY